MKNMKEVADKVVEALNKNIKQFEGDVPVFSDKGYKPVPISKKNFHNLGERSDSKKIIFIDGGNAEIISAPNISLQLIRTASCSYEKNKIKGFQKKEFFALITSTSKDGKILFNAEVFSSSKSGLENERLIFDSLNPELRDGRHMASISKTAGIVRRLAEIQEAAGVSAKNKDSIIVMDGSLECDLDIEERLFEKLFETSLGKDNVVCALSKTTRMFSNRGNSIPAVLNEIAPEGSWCYYPLAEIKSPRHKAEMCLVKLNTRADYIFRLDIYNNQKNILKEVLELLKENSRGIVFPGYPNGLIEADKLAKVSNNEKRYLKTFFRTKIGEKWRNIGIFSKSLDAHSILDSIG